MNIWQCGLRPFVLALFFVLAITGWLFMIGPPSAQAAPAIPAGGEENGQEKTYEVRMEADRFIFDDKHHKVRLIGNVKFTHKDTIMTAPHAEYDTQTQIADFTGGVKITQPETTVTGGIMTVYYKERRAVLSNGVKIVTTRQPKKVSEEKVKEELAKAPTVMICDNLDFFWVKKEATATGNVKVTSGKNRAFCDHAFYSDRAQRITLTGNVRFERGDNDWMTCEEAILNLDEETFVAQGNVEGRFEVKEEKGEAAEEGGGIGEDRLDKAYGRNEFEEELVRTLDGRYAPPPSPQVPAVPGRVPPSPTQPGSSRPPASSEQPLPLPPIDIPASDVVTP